MGERVVIQFISMGTHAWVSDEDSWKSSKCWGPDPRKELEYKPLHLEAQPHQLLTQDVPILQ